MRKKSKGPTLGRLKLLHPPTGTLLIKLRAQIPKPVTLKKRSLSRGMEKRVEDT